MSDPRFGNIQARSCGCIGPQNGEPLCPCMMPAKGVYMSMASTILKPAQIAEGNPAMSDTTEIIGTTYTPPERFVREDISTPDGNGEDKYIRAYLHEAERARADKAEAERDAAIAALSEAARLRGEAEGKLLAAETPGVLEGWRRRAEKAEAKLAEYKMVASAIDNQWAQEVEAVRALTAERDALAEKLAKVTSAYRVEAMRREAYSHEAFDRHIAEITGGGNE